MQIYRRQCQQAGPVMLPYQEENIVPEDMGVGYGRCTARLCNQPGDESYGGGAQFETRSRGCYRNTQ